MIWVAFFRVAYYCKPWKVGSKVESSLKAFAELVKKSALPIIWLVTGLQNLKDFFKLGLQFLQQRFLTCSGRALLIHRNFIRCIRWEQSKTVRIYHWVRVAWFVNIDKLVTESSRDWFVACIKFPKMIQDQWDWF